MTFDPRILAARELGILRNHLAAAGYQSGSLAESFGIASADILIADVARHSLHLWNSTRTSPTAILAKLFMFCAPVPMHLFDSLPGPLTAILREYGLVAVDAAGCVTGKVSVNEIGGYYYLADRLFENRSGIVSLTPSADACMPPHASSLELMKAIESTRPGSTILDVGCGSGCLSLPFAGTGGKITGIDISDRAVAFACANASLNGLTAEFSHADWKEYKPPQRYDHVVFNSPSAAMAFEFANLGIPRLLAPGGHARIWLRCEVLAEDGDIYGTISRATSIAPQFILQITAHDESPFSLSAAAIESGKRPRRTLLVKHASEWNGYVDSLRSRGVAEVASIVLDISHNRAPLAGVRVTIV
jgi:SAM-dependent methyltransferase